MMSAQVLRLRRRAGDVHRQRVRRAQGALLREDGPHPLLAQLPPGAAEHPEARAPLLPHLLLAQDGLRRGGDLGRPRPGVAAHDRGPRPAVVHPAQRALRGAAQGRALQARARDPSAELPGGGPRRLRGRQVVVHVHHLHGQGPRAPQPRRLRRRRGGHAPARRLLRREGRPRRQLAVLRHGARDRADEHLHHHPGQLHAGLRDAARGAPRHAHGRRRPRRAEAVDVLPPLAEPPGLRARLARGQRRREEGAGITRERALHRGARAPGERSRVAYAGLGLPAEARGGRVVRVGPAARRAVLPPLVERRERAVEGFLPELRVHEVVLLARPDGKERARREVRRRRLHGLPEVRRAVLAGVERREARDEARGGRPVALRR
mmetsp:Transcript_23184/g.76135  ORF Transcript_23184/g.76135 Transcript_23184/m.76135 type:complete len:378 (-) Transcript_23184:100-1233(-)